MKARKRRTVGVVYSPGEKDAHGDSMTEEEIADAEARYRAEAKKNPAMLGLMHKSGTEGAGRVVRSWINKKTMKVRDVSGKVQTVPKGAWMLEAEWSKDAWEDVRHGQYKGYSLQGMARAESDEDADGTYKTQPEPGDDFADWNNPMASLGLPTNTPRDMTPSRPMLPGARGPRNKGLFTDLILGPMQKDISPAQTPGYTQAPPDNEIMPNKVYFESMFLMQPGQPDEKYDATSYDGEDAWTPDAAGPTMARPLSNDGATGWGDTGGR